MTKNRNGSQNEWQRGGHGAHPGAEAQRQWEEEVGPLLDGLLRDKFRLAGARLVHLTDAQATTWARAREHATC